MVVEADDREADGLQIKGSSRKPEPVKRGGAPRGGTDVPQPQPTGRKRTPKAEIVCWKREREWILALEIPDDWRGRPGISVLQNDTSLMRDEVEDGCWHLAALSGEVVVRCNEQEETRLTCGDGDHLLFKLTGVSLNQGRRTASPSSGSYLVVVPHVWQRDEKLAGAAPVMPEPVCLEGCQAHFFDLKDRHTCEIAFRDRSGETFVIASSGPYFHLTGQEIQDGSDSLGPLFGGSPPRIRVSGGSWESVRTIIVGEEGRGRGKWRTRFAPQPCLTEQELPADIGEKGAGWYFLRFYSELKELIDSLDFRFAAGLRGITIRDVSPLPPREGHKEAVVEFHHEHGWHVEPSKPCDEALSVDSEAERTVAVIPASSKFDRSCWQVGGLDGSKVEVVVSLERIWWVLGDEHETDVTWQDQCLSCTRNDFMATSDKVISLRLPRPGWAESVRVGFSEANARQYHTRTNDTTLTIPLREFGDSLETQVVGTFPFMSYVSLAGSTYEVPLCTLSVKAGCKFDAFTAMSEDELFSHVESLHLSEFFRPLTYDEFREREPRISLAGVGVARWSVKWPDWIRVPETLTTAPWSLSEQEAHDVIFVLLDSMRSDRAVELHGDSTTALNWSDLQLQAAQMRFRIGPPAGQRDVRAWDGVFGKRVRFLAKLLMQITPNMTEQEAVDFAVAAAREVWEAFQQCDEHVTTVNERLLIPVNDARRLNPDWWRLQFVRQADTIFRCGTCGRIQPVSIRRICPRHRCHGLLQELQRGELDPNHYRHLYEAELPASLRVEEHTAQLDKEKAREFQRRFQEGRIHVLSCSTTFELGVDLGDLDTIFLRNVPPEAFNYAQRVGRSGRRGGHPGIAITYCRRRPHDLYHFSEPQRMLTGQTQPPVLALCNEKIITRHVAAIALSCFFGAFGERFSKVESFFGDLNSPCGVADIKAFLFANRSRIEQTIQRVVPDEMAIRLGLFDGSWIDQITGENSRLVLAEAEVSSDYRTVTTLEERARDGRN